MTLLSLLATAALAAPADAHISQAFVEHRDAVDRCGYRSGDVQLAWTVHDGAARDVRLVRNTTDRTQGGCVRRAVEAMRFGGPDRTVRHTVRYRVPARSCLRQPLPTLVEGRAGRFVVRTFPEAGLSPQAVEALAEGYREQAAELASRLALDPRAAPLEVVVYPSTEHKQHHTGDPGNGRVCGTTIHTVHDLVDTHELAHVLLADLGRPPPLLSEGLAVWLHWGDALDTPAAWEGWWSLGLHAAPLATARGFAEEARLRGHADEVYMLSGAVVAELAQRVGTERLVALYQRAADQGEGADLVALLAEEGHPLEALHEAVVRRCTLSE